MGGAVGVSSTSNLPVDNDGTEVDTGGDRSPLYRVGKHRKARERSPSQKRYVELTELHPSEVGCTVAALSTAGTPSDMDRTRLRIMSFGLLVIFVSLSGVSHTIFSSWACEQYEVRPGQFTSFLVKDPSVECGSEEHTAIQAIAVGMSFLWPIGMWRWLGAAIGWT